MASTLSTTKTNLTDIMDSVYQANPYRDRKGFYAHFAPTSLILTVIRHTAIQGLVYLAEPDPQPLPKETKQLATFAIQRVWKPIVKDISVSTVARIYENIFINQATQANSNRFDGDIAGGRYIRDSTKAASEAEQSINRYTTSNSSSSSLWTSLNHRMDVTMHISKHVIPAPSMIINLAVLTVEQIDTLATWSIRIYQRKQAEKILQTMNTTSVEKRQAYGTLATLDSINHGNGETTEAIQTFALNIVRTGTAILLECVGGGIGTFLLPGIGTLLGQGLGNAAAWLAI